MSNNLRFRLAGLVFVMALAAGCQFHPSVTPTVGAKRPAIPPPVAPVTVVSPVLTPPPPIIAHWSFDQDQKQLVVDSGPNAMNAKITGAVEGELPGSEPGMAGKALRFKPGNRLRIVIDPVPALDLKPPFTVAAWIKRQGAEPSSMEILCHADDTGNSGWRLRYGWESLYFVFGDGQKLITVNTPCFAIPDNKWCHVAATHDGKTVRLFVNCEQVAEQKVDAVPAPATIPAVIGNYIGNPGAYNFVGLIDELYLVGKALNGEELFNLADPPRQANGKP